MKTIIVTIDGVLVHNGYKDTLDQRDNVAKGDAGADAYHDEKGWGKREQTFQLDINGETVN